MTTVTSATSEQQTVLDGLDKEKKSNTRSAAWNFGWGALGVAAAVFLPAGGFVATFGQIFAYLKGFDLLENFGKEKALDQAKKEAADGTGAEKTAARAEKLTVTRKKLLNATLGVFAVGGALALTTWLAPALLPAVVQQVAVPLVITLGGVGVLASSVVTGLRDGAKKALSIFKDAAGPAATPAAASPDSAAVISLKQSISPGFVLAANGNTAPDTAPAVQDDTPAVKRAPKL
ncbi:MAG TPA: hypothetical protein VEF76_00740 [Patescibacteria group bacterium]|nr:hypothetical protein [Patescibacteria group bacterium]